MNNSIKDEDLQAADEPDFWRSLCPELNVTEDPFLDPVSPYPIDVHEMETAVGQIIKEGYFQTPSVIPEAECEKLKNCIFKVTRKGFPASFATVYDEFWKLFARLSNVFTPILGPNYQLQAGMNVYFVEKGIQAAGWSPHRDYELREDVLRPDGRPTLASVWIPLTDATTLNSCIYVLPTNLDPNCPGNLKKTTIDSKLLSSTRALPAKAGSILGWNQHLIHWGSRSSEWAKEPRISVGAYFQSRDVDPYVDDLVIDFSSPVSFQFRLGVIGLLIRQEKLTPLYAMPKYPDNLFSFCKKYGDLLGLKKEGLIQKIQRSRRVDNVFSWKILTNKIKEMF